MNTKRLLENENAAPSLLAAKKCGHFKADLIQGKRIIEHDRRNIFSSVLLRALIALIIAAHYVSGSVLAINEENRNVSRRLDLETCDSSDLPNRISIEDTIKDTVYPTMPEDVSFVVFMKFHKVAGSTLASLMMGLTKNHSQTMLWDCGNRFSHQVVDMYAKHETRDDYFNECLLPDQRPKCDGGDCKLVVVMRNPLEQVVSQFFFFREFIKKALARHANVFEPVSGRVGSIYERLLSDPHLLEVPQMRTLVKANPLAFEYLYGLGREFPSNWRGIVHLSDGVLSKAIHSLNTDFEVVGITESMATLFPLLSRRTRIPLAQLCETRDLSLGIQTLYSSTFGANKRPKGQDLFSEEVFRALEEEMGPSIEVYQEARRVHLEQLRESFPEFSLFSDDDLATAVANLWNKTCCNKQRSLKYPVGIPDHITNPSSAGRAPAGRLRRPVRDTKERKSDIFTNPRSAKRAPDGRLTAPVRDAKQRRPASITNLHSAERAPGGKLSGPVRDAKQQSSRKKQSDNGRQL